MGSDVRLLFKNNIKAQMSHVFQDEKFHDLLQPLLGRASSAVLAFGHQTRVLGAPMQSLHQLQSIPASDSKQITFMLGFESR